MNRLIFDYIFPELADFWLMKTINLTTKNDVLLLTFDDASGMLKLFFTLDPSSRTDPEIHEVANSLTEELKRLLIKFTDQIEVSVIEENGTQIRAC